MKLKYKLAFSVSLILLCINTLQAQVPVTGILISVWGGYSISSPGGTCQLLAGISPTNATDQTVTWTITNNTGAATINQNGLVTAISNGTVTATATANGGVNVSNSKTITITNQNTGIEDLSNSDILIYPNPVKDFINIKKGLNKEVYEIKIYSLLGKLVQSNRLADGDEAISLEKLEKGIYILQISLGKKIFQHKLIKE